MFKTPILFIIYNRVELTHDVFQVIQKIQPEKLYVVADGHRPKIEDDYLKCLRTRSVIMPDWNCDLKTQFRSQHLGKGKGVAAAITWFFEQEPEGIILYDDTLPHPDFFEYCRELLEKYRDDHRVAHIGGANFQKKHRHIGGSYYFSAHPSIWGWAGWRRSWENYDFKLNSIDALEFPGKIESYFTKPQESLYWIKRFNLMKEEEFDMWEYQYYFNLWNQGALSIAPRINLVTNIGMKGEIRKLRRLSLKSQPILPIVHPDTVAQNKEADLYYFKKVLIKAFHKKFASWFNKNFLGKSVKI